MKKVEEKKTVYIRNLPASIHQAIKVIAAKENLTNAEVVSKAIKLYKKENKVR